MHTYVLQVTIWQECKIVVYSLDTGDLMYSHVLSYAFMHSTYSNAMLSYILM